MHYRLFLLSLACACGAAAAGEPSTPAKEPLRLSWRSATAGLPPAVDPAPTDWRASNHTVYRLNGHIGHWRGALQLPPIDAMPSAPAASAVEPRR